MKRMMIALFSLACFHWFTGQACAACAAGSTWTTTWTDVYGQTTYSLSAPCKVYIGVPFSIVAEAIDTSYLNANVGFGWSIIDNGSTVAGGGFNWITTSGGLWQTALPVTYTGTPVDHTIKFSFSDLGQGEGAHMWASSLIGDVTVDPYPPASSGKPSKIGIYHDGTWYLDMNGDGQWEGMPTDASYSFGDGLLNAVRVTGDWTGDGKTKIGIYADGIWYLDLNGNGAWDETPTDGLYSFGNGIPNAVPITGDWIGDGKTKIGIFADGIWYLDLNGNGAWDGTPTDGIYSFGGGIPNAVPVTGDWTGDGKTKIGIFADGIWYLDLNGNGAWDGTPTDAIYSFGVGAVNVAPVTGDWNGDGKTEVGVYADGVWYLDNNGNGVWDGMGTDLLIPNFGSGMTGVQPAAGAW